MNRIIKIAVTAGLTGALLVFGYTLLLAFLGQDPFGRYRLLFMGIYAIAFALSMVYFRDRLNNKLMSAQEGLLIGLSLNIVAALSYCLFVWVFLANTQLGMASHQMHLAALLKLAETGKESLLTDLKYTEEQYNEIIANVKQMSYFDLASDSAIGVAAVGLFHSFLFMLLFKRK